MDKTETLYARVPVDVKQAVQAYASENGKTLANGVSDLLRLGLAGVAPHEPDGPVDLERWHGEVMAVIRVQSVSKLMIDLANSILAGRTSDVIYYRRARMMLAGAVAEWGLTVSAPLEAKESDNG